MPEERNKLAKGASGKEKMTVFLLILWIRGPKAYSTKGLALMRPSRLQSHLKDKLK